MKKCWLNTSFLFGSAIDSANNTNKKTAETTFNRQFIKRRVYIYY